MNQFNPIDEILNELKQYDLIKVDSKNLTTNRFYICVSKNDVGENTTIQYFYYVKLLTMHHYYTNVEYYIVNCNFKIKYICDSYYNFCYNYLSQSRGLDKYLTLSIQNLISSKIVIHCKDLYDLHNSFELMELDFNNNHENFYNYLTNSIITVKYISCKL